jgi:integrase
MPRRTTGSVYPTAAGWGIRWPEDGRRRHQAGFATKTEARRWFTANVAPRLDRGAPSPEISFDAFCELFLERHGATVSERTTKTLEERLQPARETFGDWTLAELEGAAADVARWRAGLTETSRYRLTLALRQALGAAVRWRYMARNSAIEAGRNPEPRSEELLPFTPAEVEALEAELGTTFGPMATFAAETGLRTNEWIALERRDIDRSGPAVLVQRRFADGVLTPYPKTVGSRRRVPLSARAQAALDRLPPPARYAAALPRRQGRPYRARHLAHPRVVSGPRGRWPASTWPLPIAPQLRHRGVGRGHLDLRAGAGDGDQREDDRPHLRPPCPRLRAGDPCPSRCESRAFWRCSGVAG